MNQELWNVVETSLFQEAADKFLSDRELSAMRRELVAEPLAGKTVAEYPGFLILDWGKANPIEVLYAVAVEKQTIVLVDIQPSTGKIVVEKGALKTLKDAYELVKRPFGYVAGRGLWEVIKNIFDIGT